MSLEAEAATQVISMTVKGVEVVVKIAGQVGSKGVSLTMAAIKKIIEDYNEGKLLTPGEKHFFNMSKSGKPLIDFVIPEYRVADFVPNSPESA